MTIGEWLTQAQSQMGRHHIPGGRLDSQLLLGHALGKSKEWLLAHPEEKINKTQTQAADQLLARRLNHEPVVHLTGRKEFYGLEFEITPDVLTPRAESEEMIAWAIKLLPQGGRVIDLGTGSGALIVALAKHRPDLEMVATDISAPALNMAVRNAQRHGVTVNFVESDLWSSVTGSFNAVVTNLPYLTDDAELTEEVKKEPAVALFGGPDGLDLYRRMLIQIPERLHPGGWLFTECDPWQQEALQAEAAKYDLSVKEEAYFVLGFKKA